MGRFGLLTVGLAAFTGGMLVDPRGRTWHNIPKRGSSVVGDHCRYCTEWSRGKTFIKTYLNDIGHVGLLDAGEEERVGAEIAGGSIQARNRLVMANVRFVVSIAKKYRTQGLDFLDLIQAGNVGLVEAAGRFDVRKGCRLSTYAKWQIRLRVQRARRAEMKHAARRAVASDDPDDGDMLKTIPDDRADVPGESAVREDDVGLVQQALDCMGDRAAAIVRERFGMDGEQVRTRDEIGSRLGVTPERVRQIEQRALGRMKKLLEDE